MKHGEYLVFLKYLYDRSSMSRSGRWRHPESLMHYGHLFEEAADALSVVHYIERHCRTDDAIYRTFTTSKLLESVRVASNNLGHCQRELDETGLLDLLEDHWDELLDGLAVDDFPSAELKLLADLGSQDPEADLRAVLHMLKSRRKYQRESQVSIRRDLKKGKEELDITIKETWWEASDDGDRPAGKRPRKNRQWFRRLGQVLEGGVYTLGDIAIAAGGTLAPVPPGSEPWRAIASVRVGVGLAMEGVRGQREE